MDKQEEFECKRKFGYFWEKEWNNLEGEINQFTYKFWKEAWNESRQQTIAEEIKFLEDKWIMLDSPDFDDNDAGIVRKDIMERLSKLKERDKNE